MTYDLIKYIFNKCLLFIIGSGIYLILCKLIPYLFSDLTSADWLCVFLLGIYWAYCFDGIFDIEFDIEEDKEIL